jgi:hypothetical protein
MRNKIKSIKEKVPQVTTLPDGYYNGIWGGYSIDVNFKSKNYELETEEGVRGMGIKVIVEVKDGVATFEEINS